MDARLASLILPLALMLLACQTGGQMSSSDPIVVPDDLAAALAEFQPFLLADDEEQSVKVGASDSETLRRLAEAVEPLFDEINATLDATDEAPCSPRRSRAWSRTSILWLRRRWKLASSSMTGASSAPARLQHRSRPRGAR